jgi:hypothetical protein
MSVTLVRRIEWVPSIDGSSPIIATQFFTSRAYCRVVIWLEDWHLLGPAGSGSLKLVDLNK